MIDNIIYVKINGLIRVEGNKGALVGRKEWNWLFRDIFLKGFMK